MDQDNFDGEISIDPALLGHGQDGNTPSQAAATSPASSLPSSSSFSAVPAPSSAPAPSYNSNLPSVQPSAPVNVDINGNVINHPTAVGLIIDGRFKCSICPGTRTVKYTTKAIRSHLSSRHKVDSAYNSKKMNAPRRCGGCTDRAVYANYFNFETHLREVHGLRGKLSVWLKRQFHQTSPMDDIDPSSYDGGQSYGGG